MNNEMKSIFRNTLNANKIQVDALPEPIRKKITIFNGIEEDWKGAEANDRELIQNKLIELDQEIHDDILEEYEDQLANNDVIEDHSEKKPKLVKEKGKNEKFLDTIFKGGNLDKLSKSFLKSKGLDVDFAQWEIIVGPYTLYRKDVFSYHFRLDKKVE